jgi:hypothetical protein
MEGERMYNTLGDGGNDIDPRLAPKMCLAPSIVPYYLQQTTSNGGERCDVSFILVNDWPCPQEL